VKVGIVQYFRFIMHTAFPHSIHSLGFVFLPPEVAF